MLEFLIVVLALLIVVVIKMFFTIYKLAKAVNIMNEHLAILTSKNADPVEKAVIKKAYEVLNG